MKRPPFCGRPKKLWVRTEPSDRRQPAAAWRHCPADTVLKTRRDFLGGSVDDRRRAHSSRHVLHRFSAFPRREFPAPSRFAESLDECRFAYLRCLDAEDYDLAAEVRTGHAPDG